MILLPLLAGGLGMGGGSALAPPPPPAPLPLLHSPADVMRWLLVALGHGGNPNIPNVSWPAYADGEPSAPDEVITCYNTAAQEDGRLMVTGEAVYHYGVQVRVRGRTVPSAWPKVEAIRNALMLDVYQNIVTVGAYRYLVHCVSKAIFGALGKDVPATKRNIYTINCLLTVVRVS